MPDVIIVGAGLAGLSCAINLQSQGASYLLLDAADAVGGRIRTDRHEGFLLDRGFQVYLTAYPTASRYLDSKALRLASAEPGAIIRHRGEFETVADPWRRPSRAISTISSSVGSFRDKLLVPMMRFHTSRVPLHMIFQQEETSCAEALRDQGFSKEFIDTFFRPYFGGIFLDRSLQTSSAMMQFVFRMMAEGDAALPADGMEAIPRHLAQQIDQEAIWLSTKVDSAQHGHVRTSDGEELDASAIVVATDSTQAAVLTGTSALDSGWTSTTCLYFAAKESPVEGGWLVLNGEGEGFVNNLMVLSQVQPSYAPTGRHLVCASVIGTPPIHDSELVLRVRAQLKEWYGPQVDGWEHLRTYRIRKALPLQRPGFRLRQKAELPRGLFACGDYLWSGSIDGAISSGEACARNVIEFLNR